MIFQTITHFPNRYEAYLETGLPARAHKKNLFQVHTVQLRDFADEHRKGRVDDSPYGGGPGMVLQVPPIDRALKALPYRLPVVLFTPRGVMLTQKRVTEFAKEKQGYTLICGYYEGVDERVAQNLADYEVSIGDFILGSGDTAALCFIEAITRLLPGYMGCEKSIEEESMEDGLLEYPHYTRPIIYKGWKVPEILLSGNHKAISTWRSEQRREITQLRKKENERERL